MCTGAEILFISAAVGGAAATVQASNQEAKARKAQGRYAYEEAQKRAARMRLRSKRFTSRQLAAFASNGVDLSSTTVLDVIGDSAAQAEYDAAVEETSGANALSLAEYEAKQIKKAGRAQAATSLITTGALLYGGGGPSTGGGGGGGTA